MTKLVPYPGLYVLRSKDTAWQGGLCQLPWLAELNHPAEQHDGVETHQAQNGGREPAAAGVNGLRDDGMHASAER